MLNKAEDAEGERNRGNIWGFVFDFFEGVFEQII